MRKPCTSCGEPHNGPGRCPDCTRNADAQRDRTSATQRGYTSAWNRLSRQARRAQPFCSTCGATQDLTCDHSPQAWERHQAGLPIRLEDVDVLCRPCNARKGRARPQGAYPQVTGSPTPRGRRGKRYTPGVVA